MLDGLQFIGAAVKNMSVLAHALRWTAMDVKFMATGCELFDHHRLGFGDCYSCVACASALGVCPNNVCWDLKCSGIREHSVPHVVHPRVS